MLGWPKNPILFQQESINIPPEPQKSDGVSANENYHGYDKNPPPTFSILGALLGGPRLRPTNVHPDGISKLSYELPLDTNFNRLRAQAEAHSTGHIELDESGLNRQFTEMKSDFERFRGYIETEIKRIQPNRNKIIKYMEVCNKIIADMEEFNLRTVQLILARSSPNENRICKKNIISMLKIFWYLNFQI